MSEYPRISCWLRWLRILRSRIWCIRLFPEEMERKLWKLPVEELFYVGHATKKKLHALGIHTIGELARTDLDILRAHFKKYGEVIYAFANGIDVSVVSEEVPAE